MKEALAAYEESDGLFEEEKESDTEEQRTVISNRAFCLLSLSRNEEALKMALRALKMTRAKGIASVEYREALNAVHVVLESVTPSYILKHRLFAFVQVSICSHSLLIVISHSLLILSSLILFSYSLLSFSSHLLFSHSLLIVISHSLLILISHFLLIFSSLTFSSLILFSYSSLRPK